MPAASVKKKKPQRSNGPPAITRRVVADVATKVSMGGAAARGTAGVLRGSPGSGGAEGAFAPVSRRAGTARQAAGAERRVLAERLSPALDVAELVDRVFGARREHTRGGRARAGKRAGKVAPTA